MRAMCRNIVLCLLTVPMTAFATVEFVSSPPLQETTKTSVLPCSTREVVQLPVITWGGDIPTILANGNQIDTARGSLFDKAGLRIHLIREDVLSRQLESYLSCKSPFLRGT